MGARYFCCIATIWRGFSKFQGFLRQTWVSGSAKSRNNSTNMSRRKKSRACCTGPKRSYPGKPDDGCLFSTSLIDQFTSQAGMDSVLLLERGARGHSGPLGASRVRFHPSRQMLPTGMRSTRPMKTESHAVTPDNWVVVLSRELRSKGCSRPPLVPAPRRLRDMLKDRKP